MGIAISNLSQRKLSSKPTAIDLGGVPDIYIFGEGSGRRYKYFYGAISDPCNVKTITCPKTRPEKAATKELLATHSLESSALKLKAFASESSGDESGILRIFIDVSCLSRPMIATLFAAIRSIVETRSVQLNVGYSLASYASSPSIWARPNRSICPVHPSFSGWSIEGPNSPLDIVVGLGYEKGKALGAVEYLEPRYRWVFVPESTQAEYLVEVEKHNKELITANQNRVSHYQVLSPVDTYFALRSLVQGMARDSRPVLLPFGPKIFFALNLLVALTIEEAAVWHVDGENDEYGDRQPSRESVVFSCNIQVTDQFKLD